MCFDDGFSAKNLIELGLIIADSNWISHKVITQLNSLLYKEKWACVNGYVEAMQSLDWINFTSKNR